MQDVWNTGYERLIESRYMDPVDVVWLATARRLGLRVRRNAAIFSATDGQGLLELGPRSTLDPDDSTAQMIFHEICHWIVNGPEAVHQRDWGFALDAELDWREHACLRLQAALGARHGLRTVLAPTSQFRAYYDAIPDDPFGPMPAGAPLERGGDPEREAQVCARARSAAVEAAGAPWGEALDGALKATAALRAALLPFFADYASDVDLDELPSLWFR
ncbi:MAG: hypothetical protein EXR69_08095 [Myxococcales bacterium]|nr:hypothetical protein [Myxococcales bacterium]